MREHSLDLHSVALLPAILEERDCVLAMTNGDVFDYSLIQKYSLSIVDTRGVYQRAHANVAKA